MNRIKKLSLLFAFILLHGIGFSQYYYYAFDERSDLTRMEEDILVEFPSVTTTNDVETWATNNNIFGPNTQILDLLNNQFVLRDIVNNSNHSFVDGYSNGDLVRIKSGLWAGNYKMYYANRIILKVKEGIEHREVVDNIVTNYNLIPLETTVSYEAYDVGEQDALTIANLIQESGSTVYSTPDFFAETEPHQYIPNDAFFGNQFGMHNTGQALQNQTPGTFDADIDAPEAWDFTKGSSAITVAVIDDGVMDNHYDLPSSRQIRLNGSNFAAPYDNPISNPNNPEPSGTDYHGTPIAGLIAATMDNYEGVAGVAPNCKIMPVRIKFGLFLTSVNANAIDFAWQNGADVINCSWGYKVYIPNYAPPTVNLDPNLFPNIVTAINNAVTLGRNPVQNQTIGTVVVFAAGNYAHLDEVEPGFVAFPANVLTPGVLTVGASDRNDKQSNYSPMGTSVPGQQLDVVAPSHSRRCDWAYEAENVWSIDNYGPNNLGGINPWPGSLTCNWLYYPFTGLNYLAYTGHFGGTSAAAPLVSGLAALILSMQPTMDQMSVFNNITCSAQDVGGYTYTNSYHAGMGYGRINAFNSIMNLCIPNYIINWPIPAGQAIKYQAANFIVANSTINSAANTRMDNRAGDYVLIQPGFSAPYGSTYHAYIAPCTACVTDGANKMAQIPSDGTNDEAVDPNTTSFNLYPNPTNGILNVEFNTGDKFTGDLIVTDMTGRTLKTFKLENSENTTIDMSDYNTGIYFVNLISQNNVRLSKKFALNR